jgi:methionine-rich copper-binding protein CopC
MRVLPSAAGGLTARRRSLIALLPLTALAFLPRAALAHAIVTQSIPAAGASLKGPDIAIELRFNSRVDRPRCRLVLVAPGGGTSVLELRSDSPPQTLGAAAKGLAPGAYRLRWQVLAVDGHITRGDIPFTVTAP